ncbi:MAG: hypothetical protein A2293_10660 [Elusimicrobia bacterium RIFOXYB2_FULL_49_7]|nr:MAG: hypothetical protein A2293_10660 [Elusimicrobia bacterium RIFOXYB2_FULL_49_7]
MVINLSSQSNSHQSERPVVFADRIGRLYAEAATDEHKKGLGQYLTPVPVADFMGSLISARNKSRIRILDPGIGSSILSCGACESLITRNTGVKEVELVGYELDKKLLPTTQKALHYLKDWMAARGVTLEHIIKRSDFILENGHVLQENLSLFASESESPKYDIVISNPPYFKIGKDDPRAMAASSVVHGQPNIYALFMAISAYLMDEKGDFIFITPRSYASGPYFKRFREVFFSKVVPEHFHIFGSRKEAFDRDSVLQENLILHAKRRTEHSKDHNKTVKISFSQGSNDLSKPVKRTALLKDVINPKDKNVIIFIPTTDEEEQIIARVNSWKSSLHKYEMEISTGPVVPFRATKFIRYQGDIKNGEAPLIWMINVRDGKFSWPLRERNKEQYIIVDDESMPLLVPNRNYVFLRRFSAKEEEKRLNSSAYLKNDIPCKWLGLENHINYVHRPDGEITKEEALGVSAILNSRFLDTYFRTSNGNTQVSATEIRDMPLPDISIIQKIGSKIEKEGVESVELESILP